MKTFTIDTRGFSQLNTDWHCLLGYDSEEFDSEGPEGEYKHKLPNFLQHIEAHEEENADTLQTMEQYKSRYREQIALWEDGSAINKLTEVLKALAQLRAVRIVPMDYIGTTGGPSTCGGG